MLGLDNVTVRYGALTALDSVSLDLADGERLAVLGPSGSGKSTLLRVVAGLEPPASGRLTWDGEDLAGVPVHERRFGLMFQDYVLFPHRTVAGNVAFGLEMAGLDRAAARQRVDEVLELVGLSGYGARPVTALSGGEQQRVALARALAPNPRLLMLDEPLGALDRTLRERLLTELSELFQGLKLSIIYVTHDQEEALAMGDHVAVLNDGRLEALATPRDLWLKPPNEFVARFLGLNNIVDGTISGGRAQTPWGPIPVPAGTNDGAHRLLIRPEGLRAAVAGTICGMVRDVTFRGARTVVAVAVDRAPELEVHLSASDEAPPVGGNVCFSVDPASVVMLPAEVGANLSA